METAETQQQRRITFTWSWSEVREMTKMNFNGPKALAIISMIIMMSFAVFAINSVEPSKPTSMNYKYNSTNSYPLGDVHNYTRGFIHTVNIEEKQPTFKWVGVVGNISGSYALQDSHGYALYDWTMTTVKGEIYATRHGGTYIPNWEYMECATSGNITQEVIQLNHTTTYGATANEDALDTTFTEDGADFNAFYIGQDVRITDSATCSGVNLNMNDSHSSVGKNWTELALVDNYGDGSAPGDGFYETETPGVRYKQRLTFVSILQNGSMGYHVNNTYNFQMLLPQSGLAGDTVANIAYYFYVELI